jgi:hypothetical protein
VALGPGKRVIGIHNGHVTNWQYLKEKYERKDLEVDSEHIFRHLAENRSLEDLVGRGTFVWFENEDPRIHLARWNFGDLELGTLEDGTIVFASTRDALLKAARAAKVKFTIHGLLEDSYHHVLQEGENGFFTVRKFTEKLALGESWRNVNTGVMNGGRGNRGRGQNFGSYNGRLKICHGNSCTAQSDTYICKDCVKKMRALFNKEKARAISV